MKNVTVLRTVKYHQLLSKCLRILTILTRHCNIIMIICNYYMDITLDILLRSFYSLHRYLDIALNNLYQSVQCVTLGFQISNDSC